MRRRTTLPSAALAVGLAILVSERPRRAQSGLVAVSYASGFTAPVAVVQHPADRQLFDREDFPSSRPDGPAGARRAPDRAAVVLGLE
jgi:hypothetical protein